MQINEIRSLLENGGFDDIFRVLYGTERSILDAQKKRYSDAVDAFRRLYPERTDIHIYSASGRTEIGGNHTDHQHGCVLAAAVNLDAIAVVSFHEEKMIRVQSAGYPADVVDLSDLSVQEGEAGSAAMIRGIAARFTEMGASIGGFDAYTTSDVLSGSGISSSAAFEVLIGTVIDQHYLSGRAGAVEIAKIGQYAENVYFGKKSGLMDQMVSSVGGFVFIDFHDTEQPVIERHSFSFEEAGYCLCITDTKGSHADLTDDYVAIPMEMGQVAALLGAEYLRDADEDMFYQNLPRLREACSDRAILRAAHFFAENRRAGEEARALSEGNMERFLCLVRESGQSSAQLLQNLYSSRKAAEQAIPLGLMISERVLGEQGAVRVHGGGFAGTIQAFVPLHLKEAYQKAMDALYGENSCHVLRIRPVGGVEITALI
ncbi:MAG: galactokinase [Ruminococcus sp.]|nr:galactokinase [Ruminococcus sp.]